MTDRLYDKLKREYDNYDYMWGNNRAREITGKVSKVIEFLEKWYAPDLPPHDTFEIVKNYYNMSCNENYYNGVFFGYTYTFDELKKFVQNPDSMWELYDSTMDKNSFYKQPFIRYTNDESKNHEMFLRDAFWNMISDNMLNRIIVDSFSPEDRKKFAAQTEKDLNTIKKSAFEKRAKTKFIQTIQSVIKNLDDIGALEQCRDNHNKNMQNVKLEGLAIPEEVLSIDESGRVFGFDLNNCSVFQLECLLGFYSNRLEKVKEDVGIGLFMLGSMGDEALNPKNSEALKEVWKKYQILSMISGEAHSVIYDLKLESSGKLSDDDLSDAYIKFIEKYSEAYSKIFNGEKTDLMKDMNFFGMINTSHKHNNYLTKSRLIEDVILQADRQKVNWGVMSEDGEINLKKRVLIGVDVPGFNMPLRLHYSLKDLQTLMRNYVGTDEVPIYIGSEDFNLNGKNIGTQLLLPISPKQSNFVKARAKSKTTISSELSKWAKHIACMQLPNMVKKLLAERSEKTQRYPDYINIFTRKIRKVEMEKEI